MPLRQLCELLESATKECTARHDELMTAAQTGLPIPERERTDAHRRYKAIRPQVLSAYRALGESPLKWQEWLGEVEGRLIALVSHEERARRRCRDWQASNPGVPLSQRLLDDISAGHVQRVAHLVPYLAHLEQLADLFPDRDEANPEPTRAPLAFPQEVPEGGVNETYQPSGPLTPEDCHILTVLDANRPGALTYAQIVKESVRLELADRKKVRRLNDSAIRARVPFLLRSGLIERPPGTKKKGVGITDRGRQTLADARANSTENQR
jgi:hypothetical protein